MTVGLQAVAGAFQASLTSRHSVLLSRIDGLDRIGIPVVQALLPSQGGPACAGYGYGMTEIEAQVGALGELCEEVHTGTWMRTAPRQLGSYKALAEKYGADGILDPLTLCLEVGSAYTQNTVLPWVEGRRWPSNEAVLVPAELVAAHRYQLAEPAQLITPITNGLGAGFDLHHALSHGVMELLQRDGNVLSFRALDRGVVVDLERGTLPEIDALLDRLRALGIRPMIKLASTDFDLTNLYVVGDDTRSADFALQVTACGEASHPDPERAIRKALLEFIGSRSRKAATHGPVKRVSQVLPSAFFASQADGHGEEARALEAMVGWLKLDQDHLRTLLSDTVFAQVAHVRFADLPAVKESVATSWDRLDLLTARLTAKGLGIVYVDCSPPGNTVRVVRAIVPGLESETMSYHRLGWRGVTRLRARQDGLIQDSPRDGALRVLLRPEDEARCGGPAWFDAERARELIQSLYPLYRECGPFSAQRRLQQGWHPTTIELVATLDE